MLYTESPALATELIDAIESELARERAERTDYRPHVSDLIYCLRKGWRRRMAGLRPESYAKWARQKEDENSRLILIIGQALHSIVAKADGREANKQLESDWVVGEADARVIDGGTIEEFKTARAGMSEDDPLHWPHYLEQVATYVVLTREMGIARFSDVPDAVLHVLHITFNDMPRWYEPHPKQKKKETDAEYDRRLFELRTEKRLEYEQKIAEWLEEKGKHSNLRSWPLWFTDDELHRWRLELLRRAAVWSGDTEPGTDECSPVNSGNSAFSWECGYCPFFQRNGGDCPGGPGRPAGFFPIDRIEVTKP
jgi:hypothetical protein